MLSSKPKYLDPQGKLFSVFNVSNFYSDNDVEVTDEEEEDNGSLIAEITGSKSDHEAHQKIAFSIG